jgi:hypothetical protein
VGWAQSTPYIYITKLKVMNSEFKVEDGIRIQSYQLDRWKTVLIPEAYNMLLEYATRNNHTAVSGYDICRGTELDNYIHNYMLGHRF